MSLKKMFLAVLCCVSLVVVGCGGGGGGGGTTVADTNATITGNVVLPAGGDATLSNIRPAIALTNLTIRGRVGGTGDWTTGSFNTTTGAFSFAFSSPASTFADMEVVNSAGRVLVRGRVNNIAAGQTNSGLEVGATSTAVLAIIEKVGNNNLTAVDVIAQISGANLTTVINAILGFLNFPPATGSVNTANGNLDGAINGLGALTINAYDKTVRDNLVAMKTALVNGTVTPFMAYIDPNFTYAGTGATEYTTLQSTIETRLTRYTVSNYAFTVTNLAYTDASTIVTTVKVTIAVTRKAGQTGGVDSYDNSAAPLTATVTWKKQNDGTWKIFSGLPYTSEQIGGGI